MVKGVARDAGVKALARLLPPGVISDKQYFAIWERRGYHIIPVDFYQPIPNTRYLPPELWTRHSELVGLNLNESKQLDLLATFSREFREEYERFPRKRTDVAYGPRFFLDNGLFESVDAEILYCMIRSLRPKTVFEVGAGFSTLLAAQAVLKNQELGFETELVSFDPHPPDSLKNGVPGLSRVVETGIQSIPLADFERLRGDDILFIDSTHVLAIGSDVQYEMLEILPRLHTGTVVHFHDIFFPVEYPEEWVKTERRFWTEQYILQAFLAFNSAFDVLWASHFMHRVHPEALQVAFGSYERGKTTPGSFWIRRAV